MKSHILLLLLSLQLSLLQSELHSTNCLSNEPLATTEPVQQQQVNIWSTIAKTVKTAIEPEIEYIKLIKRYRVWFKTYNSIKQDGMKEASDVVKEEYARVDEELQRKYVCEGTVKDENLDYVHKTLQIVIDRLEKFMPNEDNLQGSNNQEYKVSSDVPIDEEQVKRSMEKIKSTLISSARSFITGQAKSFAQIAALKTAASFANQQMMANPDNSTWAILAPILALIGHVDTPLLAHYLSNLEFRTAMSVVNRFNPMQIVCKIGATLGIQPTEFFEHQFKPNGTF